MTNTTDRLRKMEAQLDRWSLRIDRIAARSNGCGDWVTIGDGQRLEDLRVRRAIAQTRFDAYRMADDAQRESLRAGVEHAWNELALVMKKVRG